MSKSRRHATSKRSTFSQLPFDHQTPLFQYTAIELQQGKFQIFHVPERSIESTGMVTQVKTPSLPKENCWGHRFQQIIRFDHKRSYSLDYEPFHQTIEDPLTPRCAAKDLVQH